MVEVMELMPIVRVGQSEGGLAEVDVEVGIFGLLVHCVRDLVLPFQPQYSAEEAEMEVIQLSGLVRVDGPGLCSKKECRHDDGLVHLQFGFQVNTLAISHGGLKPAEEATYHAASYALVEQYRSVDPTRIVDNRYGLLCWWSEKSEMSPAGRAGPRRICPSLHQSSSLGSEGADDGGKLVSPKRQVEVHQAIIDTLWQIRQKSHDIPPDGKSNTSVLSLFLWPAAPEELVASTHLLQLTLLRKSGLAESNNVHLVARPFPGDFQRPPFQPVTPRIVQKGTYIPGC
ncbi:unnamed protein product [Schistocephalus solidus]|uniref:Uncharacterized protein n=1 Tax=Schistocephalus solidus TaxID=70667 RepID=A0A183S9F4_SCHSO|nr:unnamed protein product [Schistocephalus solidus]